MFNYEKLMNDVKENMLVPKNFSIEELKEAVDNLEGKYYKLIVCKYKEKMTRPQMAKRFGYSIAWVDYNLRKAIRKVASSIRYSKKEYIVETCPDPHLPYVDFKRLSSRAFNALYRNQITPDKLKGMSDEDILNLRNIGAKSGAEIIAFRNNL